MSRMDAALDWVLIVVSPLIAFCIWTTGDIASLRYAAGLWLFTSVVCSAKDRYDARRPAKQEGSTP